MQPQFFIYGLIDPRTNQLRYIGKSSTGMSRPRTHFKPNVLRRYKSKKNSWILSLKNQQLLPKIEILEEFECDAPLNSAEKFWIASIKATGADLLNMTDGGDGLSKGFKFSEESRAKQSRSQRARGTNGLIGYKQTEEHRRKISKALKSRPKPPVTLEHKRNNAIAHGGKPFMDQDGNLYYTVNEAVKITGLNQSTIRRSLKGYTSNKNFKYIEVEK